ncbi:uncharacterized protein LACBIDRAFT_227871 [Laccaria bicolor S238N-H82]|uniref:Predicted protein n=1 Tax=Laccaria bicolor (strain S238N-H82 / ATCC MYA-4686) TaxID=486041 RepID=B0CPB0_LACBS|nr:uncharacterized protein LACBIDRAFT_227871 [Laccaria bicolor S238N-H82]EDR15444.1 predicted protein [Laccaria bicolor S238N-H82]|eukprot:XP_001873652.1 predicted protein [Laccaria bicolor S238N-H82]
MAALTIARAYQHSFDTHPNSTLAITGGCLNALGDFVAQISQKALRKEQHGGYEPYDFLRTLRFFCFGFTISPFMGRWNSFLESRFPLRSLKANTKRVSFRALSKRVACDQLIVQLTNRNSSSAPIGLALFLGSMGMMEGRTPYQIKEKCTDLYPKALIANWKAWPLAQLVNFRYMPLPYRVPFSQACGVFWTLYLSIINSECVVHFTFSAKSLLLTFG